MLRRSAWGSRRRRRILLGELIDGGTSPAKERIRRLPGNEGARAGVGDNRAGVEGERGKRWFQRVPLFDPSAGATVIEPPGKGPGYWAGAPSAVYDQDTDTFFLHY